MKKKVLLVALAMVLVCALSIMGTMALLAEQRGVVTNTFVAAVPGGENFVDTFDIKEYEAKADAKGNYTLDTTSEVGTNSYTVTPGVTLPKDAFVKLSRENKTPAYLFIKVVNTLDSDVFTMDVNTEVWTEVAVPDVTDGTIYVLSEDVASNDPTVLKDVSNGEYHIIDGDKVTVANVSDLAITTGTADSIQFYAYICQATVAKADGTNTSNPAEVFGICFPNTPSNP